jgi:hypothetical protein
MTNDKRIEKIIAKYEQISPTLTHNDLHRMKLTLGVIKVSPKRE